MTSRFWTLIRGEMEVELEISGEIHAPEFDVGIMGPWADEISAKTLDGEPFELTDQEDENASMKLAELYYDEIYD